MTPKAIKSHLIKMGLKLSAIADRLKVNPATVSRVLDEHTTSARILDYCREVVLRGHLFDPPELD